MKRRKRATRVFVFHFAEGVEVVRKEEKESVV